MNLRPTIRAHAAPWNQSIDILVISRRETGQPFTAARLTFEPVDEFTHIEPTASLDHKDAQTLMDDLWQAGLRPTEGTGSAGAFAAQGKHLEDMRRLVFEEAKPSIAIRE